MLYDDPETNTISIYPPKAILDLYYLNTKIQCISSIFSIFNRELLFKMFKKTLVYNLNGWACKLFITERYLNDSVL